MRRTGWTAAVGIGLALAGANCTSSTDNGGGGDVEDFKVQLEEAFTNNLAGFSNAIQRLVLAATGQPQNGVTLTPITGGVQGSLGVDVDGDGSLETQVQGRLIFINPSQGLAGGANFTLTGIVAGAPQTASGSAVITQVSASIITITNGNFSTHTDTRDNDASVSGVNLTTDVSGGGYKVTGTADFEFNGVDGLFTFAPNGNWFKITVTGDSFDTFVIQ
jgi:hypothetical protein